MPSHQRTREENGGRKTNVDKCAESVCVSSDGLQAECRGVCSDELAMCDGEEESLERRYSAALNHLPDGHECELEQGEEGGKKHFSSRLLFSQPAFSNHCWAAAPSLMSEDQHAFISNEQKVSANGCFLKYQRDGQRRT